MKTKIVALIAALMIGGTAFAVAQFQHNKQILYYEVLNDTDCCTGDKAGPVTPENIVVTNNQTGEQRTLALGESWAMPRETPIKPPFAVQSTTGLCVTSEAECGSYQCQTNGCIWLGNGAVLADRYKYTVTKRCPLTGCPS